MRRALLVVAVVLFAGIAVLVGLSEDPVPAPTVTASPSIRLGFPVAPPPGSDPTTDPEALQRGPNGMPLDDLEGRTLRTQGLPGPRPVEGRTDAAGWVERGRSADQTWARGTLDVSARFAAEQALSDVERAAVTTALTTFVHRVQTTRAGIREGTVHPSLGRQILQDARSELSRQITGAMGEERAELLRARLERDVHGGGW